MNEIVPLQSPLPRPLPSSNAVVTVTVSDDVRRLVMEAEAPSTRKAYATDIRTFQTWCRRHGYTALPATPETVCEFVVASMERKLRPSTIQRRMAAIRYMHRLADLETPTKSELVAKAIKGMRRELGALPDRKAPATADIVGRMLDSCDDSLIGLRDRALLALGFAGAFRRSELVALTTDDIEAADDGIRVTIRKSKGDQEGMGQTIAILGGNRLRPVAALNAWLAAAGIESGPLFRRVRVGDEVGTKPLSEASVALIVKKRCTLIGEDPGIFSGHSLRAGFLTSAARSGASIFKMRDVSRHKSLETLNGYVRDAELFRDHAGSAFL